MADTINREQYAANSESDECITESDEYFDDTFLDESEADFSVEDKVVKYVKEGNLAELEALQKQGFDFNFITAKGSLLHQAIRTEQDAVADFLIDNGIDLSITNRRGQPAIFNAIWHENVDVINRMLDYDCALVNFTDKQGVTPLIEAANQGVSIDVFYALLGANPENINARDDFGDTALLLAAENCSWDVVELLLKEYADPYILDQDGLSMAERAIGGGQEDTLRHLIEKGLDINDKNCNGEPIFWAAIRKRNPLMLQQLCDEYGADLSLKDDMGNSVWHWAARYGDPQICEELAAHHCRYRTCNQMGQQPLFWAVRYGNVEVVKYFVNEMNVLFNEKQIQKADTDGNNLLHMAAHSGNVLLGHFFVQIGVPYTKRNKAGLLPYEFAEALSQDSSDIARGTGLEQDFKLAEKQKSFAKYMQRQFEKYRNRQPQNIKLATQLDMAQIRRELDAQNRR